MKKLTYVILAMSLCAAVTFATGQQESAEGDTSAPVSVMVYERGWVVPEEGTITDSRWTQWMDEQLDVEIEWIAVPRGEVMGTLNTLFAAGNAPDLIHDFPRSTITNFRNQGVLRPVDDMIEDYSTAYREYLDDTPELLPYLTFEDGQMWALSSKRPIDSIENHTMWIRQDWLDNLGLEVPQTEEEFFAVMDAFVNDDPDGNGEDDTFAFSAMPAYFPIIDQIYATRDWYIEDGEATNRIFTPRFIKTLEFHKRAYDRGWLDAEYITDVGLQRQNQFWVTGRAGVAFAGLTPPNFDQLRENVPTAELTAMGGFEHEFGRFGLLDEPPAHRFVGVSRSIRNPQGAMEFLDWMVDEGWYTLTYGLEGEHHEVVNGEIPRVTLAPDDARRILRYAFEYALLDQRRIEPSWVPVMAAPDSLSQQIADMRADALRIGIETDFRRDFPIEPANDEIGRFFAEFDPIYNELFNNTIIGGSDFQPADTVAELRAEWDRLGGDEITQIYQDFLEENRSLLGR
ncbi:MAG: extracellular solute-binding protein [Spirochaetales bacterium]